MEKPIPPQSIRLREGENPNRKWDFFSEFLSPNGINMIKGDKVHWEKKFTYRDDTGPIFYNFCYGSWTNMLSANFHPLEKRLTISSVNFNDETYVEFYVENIQDAEFIVLSSVRAMKCEIMPLYKK